MARFITPLLSVAVFLAGAVGAESFKPPELSGKVFAYYRYDLSAQDEGWREGANEFDVSRCYVNVKGAVAEKFYYRVTADIYRPTTYRYALVQDPETGEYSLEESSSKGPLAFVIKFAYLDVRDVIPRHSIYFGVIGSPWISFEDEYVWKWRVLRKNAFDDRGYGPSADLGVAVGGKFAEGLVDHNLAFTNGAGFMNAENGLSGKDVTYRLSVFPLVKNETWKGVSVSGAVRAGNLGEKVADGDAKNPILVYGGLVGLDHKFANFGAGYFMKSEGEDNAAAGTEKVTGNVLTVYANGNLAPTPWMTVHPLARYDAYEPNADQSDDERTLIIAGVGLKFFEGALAVIPNYQTEAYKAPDPSDPTKLVDKSTDYVFLHSEFSWK